MSNPTAVGAGISEIPYFIPSTDLTEADIPLVGMKNYGIKILDDMEITIPLGLALTIRFFEEFMTNNKIKGEIPSLEALTNGFNPKPLQERIKSGTINHAQREILFHIKEYFGNIPLVVRSSCNYEDLKHASFAGQYDSFLNVQTQEELEKAVLKCFASAYSERALNYLKSYGINPRDIAMSVLVQEMVAADKGVTGVILSVDPFCGSKDIMYIEATPGFCEAIVSGKVQPDGFRIRKENKAVIHKRLGTKEAKVVYAQTDAVYHPNTDRSFCLSDKQLEILCDITKQIENQRGYPVDIEFVITENTPVLVQVRPQIIDAKEYVVKTEVSRGQGNSVICKGEPVVRKAACGSLHFFDPNRMLDSYKSRIVYTKNLDITYIPQLKSAAGLIIREMGLGSHPALILSEIGMPSIANLSLSIEDCASENDDITLDASRGEILKGRVPITEERILFDNIPQPKTRVFVASSSPMAYQPYKSVPVSGILMRGGEFTIVSEIGIHPQALLDYDFGKLDDSLDRELKNKISKIIQGYSSGAEFFMSKLSEGVAMVGSLVSPDTPLLYRFCDFPSGDYAKLIGGERYEPKEQNPMIGLRGVTRMLNPRFNEAFELEAAAIRRVKDMGFSNLEILVAFCREPEDAKRVRKKLETAGFSSMRIGMMVEVPSNYLCAKEFAEVFDFFLVGPVDLTQTALAADRNNVSLSQYHNPSGLVPKRAVETLLRNLEGCGKDVIIGSYALFQHFPDYVKYQSNNRIHFAELADSLVDSIRKVYALEQKMGL